MTAPIIGRTESADDFRERQDCWLRDIYTPAMARAQSPTSGQSVPGDGGGDV